MLADAAHGEWREDVHLPLALAALGCDPFLRGGFVAVGRTVLAGEADELFRPRDNLVGAAVDNRTDRSWCDAIHIFLYPLIW